jgi:hypothetical protein
LAGTKANPPAAPSIKEFPTMKKKEVDHLENSPRGLLYGFVQELVMDAGKSGDGTITPRAQRKLQRLIIACVDIAAKELIQSTLEKYVLGQDMMNEETADPMRCCSRRRRSLLVLTTVGLL